MTFYKQKKKFRPPPPPQFLAMWLSLLHAAGISVTTYFFLFNKPNRRTNFPNLFVKKLYMFRAVPLPIIRSFPLYIRHWYMSCRSDDNLQPGSERIFHHQEFSTVHSTLVYVMQVWWQPSTRTRKDFPLSGVFHCTFETGICHAGLMTTFNQDQDGFSIIRSFPLYFRHWYMSCRFDDNLQPGPGWIFHPGPV